MNPYVITQPRASGGKVFLKSTWHSPDGKRKYGSWLPAYARKSAGKYIKADAERLCRELDGSSMELYFRPVTRSRIHDDVDPDYGKGYGYGLTTPGNEQNIMGSGMNQSQWTGDDDCGPRGPM